MSRIINNSADADNRFYTKGHLHLRLIISVLISSVAVIWMWSTAAVDVLGAPSIRFSDAFSVVLALCSLAYGCGVAFNIGRGQYDK